MDANYVQTKPKSKSGLKIFALVVGVILFMYGFWVWDNASQGRMPGYIYRDSLIIGKTKSEIKEVYGDPDIIFASGYGYSINCIFSGQCYHAIIFEDGVAVEIDRHRNGYP